MIDYKAELNAEQLDVVLNGDGPCVVLAGAGSGKTRTIVYRVAYLLEKGVAPDRILLLTFTNKAAKEMMDRLGPSAVGLWGGTFHSVANRLLRMFPDQSGFTDRFTILDEEDSKTLFKAAMTELGHDGKNKKFPSTSIVKGLVSYARNAMVPIAQATMKLQPKFEGFADEFARIAEAYDRKKRMANAMDFDDLLIRLYEALSADPELRARLSERFEYILVDEYQDTNALQAALIRLIARKEPNLLVVGDDAQSIYSFRAADVKNILDFERFYKNVRIFRLETNYRSTPEVLALANDVINRNVNQYPKQLRSVSEPGPKPMIVTAASASQEAQFVADEIDRLIHEEGFQRKEIAVLFRATHHSQSLEFELMRRGIAYDYRGGLKFFERAHVKDVLSFLKLADNIRDEAAWRRVLGFQTGIGEVSAGRVVAVVREADGLAAAVTAPVAETVGKRVAQGWTDCRDTLERMLAASASGGPAMLIRAVMQSAYAEHLENEYQNAGERMDDLEQLAALAEQYGSLSEFLAEVTLNDTLGGNHRSGNAASGSMTVLSTIHQAKGLEWDAVFVLHMNESSFPNRRAVMEEGGIEEERRLFYVAVTRAREHLCLSYPVAKSFDFSATEQPSMFLQEVDRACVDATRMRGGFGDSGYDMESDGTYEDGYEEPAIRVSADGEKEYAGLDGIEQRMKKVRTSFLKDV